MGTEPFERSRAPASSGSLPDGEQADDSSLLYVLDVGYLQDGAIVFAEWAADYAAIREVKPDGTLETLAGGLRHGFAGDGGPAVDATLSQPDEIAVATDGSILFADGARVRRIGIDGIIDTVAGTGTPRYNGDGIPATDANIAAASLAAGPNGSFLIGDFANGRIRRVSAGGIDHDDRRDAGSRSTPRGPPTTGSRAAPGTTRSAAASCAT